MLILHKNYVSDQFINLHMPQQQNCFDMCKFVTWIGSVDLELEHFLQDLNYKLLNLSWKKSWLNKLI